MRLEEITIKIRENFHPFTIIMSSGNKYPVPHPDFIFVTPRKIVVVNERGYSTDLDPMHVVGLDDLSPTSRKAAKRKTTK